MQAVDFFKCLSDETRLKSVLLIVREEELCVCELTSALDEIQPKISRHLAQLKKCGLLLDRRQGQWIFYRLNPDLDNWASEVIQTSLAANQALLDDCLRNLHNMGDRPAREQACC